MNLNFAHELNNQCGNDRGKSRLIIKYSGWLTCCVLVLISMTGTYAATLTSAPFGVARDGTPVARYTMTTPNGISVSFIGYGGAITDITTPDRHGRPGHIVLGFPTLREYETINASAQLYFGGLLGRYANWIERGRFKLDGQAHQISMSNWSHTIHGGKRGFDKRHWTVEQGTTSGSNVSARLTYTSADGEEGFPGRLQVAVTYSLSDEGAFAIQYEAETDKHTVLNLTNHMNFNLAGAGSANGVLGHLLTIDADRYLPLDRSQFPIGAPAPVEGSPFDFRKENAIGARIRNKNEQLAIADGYDHYWVLNKTAGLTQPQRAVRAVDPVSGRTIECSTTEPGVQIYTASFYDGKVSGVGGKYDKYAAFTLETQHYPNSVNHPEYPSTELTPGQIFRSLTVFRFGVQ